MDIPAFPKPDMVLEDGQVRWGADGITTRTYIVVEILKAFIIRADGMVYTDEELIDRASHMAETLLARL